MTRSRLRQCCSAAGEFRRVWHAISCTAVSWPQGPPVVGPHPDDPHEPGMLAHPMDEAHARIDAENQLILRLNDAMAFRNVKEMRSLIDEYRKLDGADTDASQAGYTVIADCIEHPGDASLAAAHHFYDTQRHSPLRRFVRRICFENTNEQSNA